MELNGKKTEIAINALKRYLGEFLRVDSAHEVLTLIQKFETGVEFKITRREKNILLSALNKHIRRFFRVNGTLEITQLTREVESVNVS